MTPKSEAEITLLRKIYPVGAVVVLEEMDDPQSPQNGTKGEIIHVDDIGQIHVRWENGSGLALIPGIDKFYIRR